MKINLPETGRPRVVIVGGGFAGLTLAQRLARYDYQIVLLDKNNYHQFQPLFYQVAMAGLEPSSISFPLRKLFQKKKNVFIRVTEVKAIEPEHNRLQTSLGICNYDYLVIATGADTNFFGNEHLQRLAIPMKSVSEALYLRNTILDHLEKALTTVDYEHRQELIDIVIAGGGPTGVEVAGALAEMKKYIIPKDYPELNSDEIDIHLIEGAPALLGGMSEASSRKALEFLTGLGVLVRLNTLVKDYDGERVTLSDGTVIPSRKVIWAAGVRGNSLPGLSPEVVTRGNRLQVDAFNRVEGYERIFALGDVAFMTEETYPKGHPQVAQVAMQQARHLAGNLRRQLKGEKWLPFHYRDLGSMATVGRNRAVVDLPAIRFQGAFAWFVWLFVHLFQLLGVRNRVIVFLNWVWNYFTYDQSLRLIIRPRLPQSEVRAMEKEKSAS